jgi:hypothetical protein
MRNQSESFLKALSLLLATALVKAVAVDSAGRIYLTGTTSPSPSSISAWWAAWPAAAAGSPLRLDAAEVRKL